MPDPITWYTLPRTVDDLTTIQEKIDEKILEHNLDPSAHGQSGEALFTHRIAALLDHVEGSVDFKHLRYNKLLLSSVFESFDGWETFGAEVNPRVIDATLGTDSVSGSEAKAYIETDFFAFELDPTKNPFFQTTVALSSNTNQLAYITAGASYDTPARIDSFGYKIDNADLYAYWTRGGTEYTQLISGITVTNVNVYRAYLDSTEEKIYFYVNGELKYTATTNFPTDSTVRFFEFYIKTLENLVKRMFLIDWYFEMDR